jgi:putative transposase
MFAAGESSPEQSDVTADATSSGLLSSGHIRALQESASDRASVFNLFNQEGSLSSGQSFKPNRIAALAEWRDLCAT